MKKRGLLIPMSLLTVPVFACQDGMIPVSGARPTTAAPAQHFSAREGINNHQTLWASWELATPATRLYVRGDSKSHSGGRT